MEPEQTQYSRDASDAAMKQLTDDVIPEQAEFEEEERRTQGDLLAAVGQALVATATSGPTNQTFRQPSSH